MQPLRLTFGHVRAASLFNRRRLLATAVVLVLVLLGLKGWRLYGLARALQADVRAIETVAAVKPDANMLASLGPPLAKARADAVALRAEAAPMLPIARRLGWLPGYGPDIAAAPSLLDITVDLATAADEMYACLSPLALRRDARQPISVALVEQLEATRPRIETARLALARASAAWAGLPIDDLSPPLRDPLKRVEPLLPSARDGVELALALPDLLGAHGRRDYLLIAQNPDELRATGGLITAAGVLTFDRGRLGDFTISDSGAVNNFASGPYPDPPEPLLRYMGLQLWAFQDANWSPDFRLAAQATADLYRLGQGRDVDGVIAIDPAAVRLLLAATGPVSVEGSREPISAANVIAYMRNAFLFTRDNAGDPAVQPWWLRRKSFMEPLASALLGRFGADPARLDWPGMARAARQMLEERHVQIYVKNPSVAAVLARRKWDGAVQPGQGDFLMVVDSNMGYNKVTPNVQAAITYTVDLSNPGSPLAELIVRHTNRLSDAIECDQTQGYTKIDTVRRYEELMVGCYWDYLRILIPRGSRFIAATATPVPAKWLLSGVGDDGATRIGAGEAGTNLLSSFLVIPPGETRRSFFRYRLPAAALSHDAQGWHYHLTIQKQAGAGALPVTVTVRLPASAKVTATSAAPTGQAGEMVSFGLVLDRDQQLDITFQLP